MSLHLSFGPDAFPSASASIGGAFTWKQAAGVRRAVLLVALTLLMSLLLLAAAALLAPGGLIAVRAAEPAGQPSQAAAVEPVPSGLFFLGGREDAGFEAPILDSRVTIRVSGRVSRVAVSQRFRNPTTAWLEGVYVFPLPERSAVDRLTMTVGERRIEGRILEREEARQVYERAAAEGRKASLLTSERPNVFVTSVANIGPGEEVSIAIEYQERVAYADGRFELRFPMVVAPRYTPGASLGPTVNLPAPEQGPRIEAQPIADRSTPPAPDGADLFGPVARPGEGRESRVALSVALDAGLPLAEVASPSHRIAVEASDESHRRVRLADPSVPADRDFVLRWRPAQGAEPEAAVFAETLAGDSYLLVSLLPPPAEASAAAPRPPRDLILVVDTSGSMYGPSMEAAREALALALEGLRPEDRFNLIRFADESRALFPQARPADAAAKRLALRAVAALEAEGGTEMLPALELALAEPAREGRLRQVVFLTDGAVGNEAALFEAIAGRLGASRLFTVGIGSAPNGYFMRKAAELGRGSFTNIARVEQVSAEMSALLRRLESPLLTGLAVGGDFGPEAELYPAPLPDLYAGEPVEFLLKLPGRALDELSGSLTVTGTRAGTPWRRSVALAGLRPGAGIAQLWARAKLERIEDGLVLGRDPEAVRAEALALALHHGLVGRYTALVAVDSEASRPEGTDMVTREQPRALPAGWDYDKVFGEAEATMPLRRLPAAVIRAAGLRGQAIALAQGATPAALQALLGLLLLGLGGALLLTATRGRRRAL